MSSIVRDSIDAEIALIVRELDAPVAPFGFGTDLSCVGDLTESMAEVDPMSPVGLGEALVRRCDCPRGQLPDDPNYGIDLRGMLNRGTTADEIRRSAAQTRGELLKDDRVDTLSVRVAPAPDGSELDITLSVQPVDPRVGEFSLTLALTDGDALIREMSA